MIVCQICYLAKKSDLEKVDFCARSNDFCKICQLNHRRIGFSLYPTLKINCELNFQSKINISEIVIACQISDSAKKSEFKKVNFCTLYINSCKICQNWISILEFFTLFLLEIYLQKLMIPVQKCTFLSSDFFALSKICHTITTQKTAKLLKK